MANGDTKTEALLNILGNGGDASEYRGCCNTKTQQYILDAIDRIENIQPGGSYNAGTGIEIADNTISVDTDTIQPKLTAGTNITISDNVISATGGGGGPTVVQTTGTSTTDVMSQDATTTALDNRVLRVAGAPSNSTPGIAGQIWENTLTGDLYYCKVTGSTTEYLFKDVESSNENLEITIDEQLFTQYLVSLGVSNINTETFVELFYSDGNWDIDDMDGYRIASSVSTGTLSSNGLTVNGTPVNDDSIRVAADPVQTNTYSWIKLNEVINNLTSNSTTVPLAAYQGTRLKNTIDSFYDSSNQKILANSLPVMMRYVTDEDANWDDTGQYGENNAIDLSLLEDNCIFLFPGELSVPVYVDSETTLNVPGYGVGMFSSDYSQYFLNYTDMNDGTTSFIEVISPQL